MRFSLVVVGASLGGTRALRAVLGALPATFPLPIAVAHHLGSDPDGDMVHLLQRSCALPVSEAEDKEVLAPGRVYLAPHGYHLLIEGGRFALSTEAPVRSARPSIDVLFESAADEHGSAVLALLMTGSSSDGADGLRAVRRAGGYALVEDPRSAECPVMPAAALSATAVDRVLPLGELAAALLALTTSPPGPQAPRGPADR